MCCFSQSVRHVGATKIFARGSADGRQVLAYAMQVELGQELAMILPLPTARASEPVRFINLEGEERFFEQLAAAFPAPLMASFAPQRRGPVPQALLAVMDVGQYEASFVPTPADFARLDARFRLPTGFLDALPGYVDYGFAVFRLKPSQQKRQQVQPMALSFSCREPRALFFPTVHVHDGHVPAQAAFDHALYCQADGVLGATLGWSRSPGALGLHVDGPRSRELVDSARGGFVRALHGTLPNADVWLREPRGVAVGDLAGRGDSYAFAVKATAAYGFGVGNTEYAGWVNTASERLAQLCRTLREGLAEIEQARRSAWHLTTLHDALSPHFMNGPQLWSGTSYVDGKPANGGGPGQICFTPFSKRVEPQQVTLGFAQLPAPEDARAIHAELSRLLERALA
jgi:hypothetical protein